MKKAHVAIFIKGCKSAPESYIFRVSRYAFRGMGYKKDYFLLKNSQPATRNSEQLRDRQTNKLKKTYYG